jgi:hypothetical protein
MKFALKAFLLFGLIAGLGPHIVSGAADFLSNQAGAPSEVTTAQAAAANPTAKKVKKKLKKLSVSNTPVSGYDRDAFGSAWADVDGNGCDTRNDILARDLKKIQVDSDGCTVLRGVLKPDPYTGKKIKFVRGPQSSVVQIDHIVALSDAWQKGAATWSDDKRRAFANDPRNLVAADGPENMSKSDKAADEWLVPQNPQWACKYAYRVVTVKKRYELAVSSAEKRALKNAC